MKERKQAKQTQIKQQPRSVLELRMQSMRILPIGFVFAPKDEDIVGYYLKHLVTKGRPLPSGVHGIVIHDVDIYSSRPPWEIAALLPEEERKDWYIFTNLKKLTAWRMRRTAENGQGTWKGQTVATQVIGAGGSVVGEKRMLSFMVNDGSAAQGTTKKKKKKKQLTSHWNLNEYSVLQIDGKPVTDGADGRWVICHVTYNEKFGKKRRSGSGSGPSTQEIDLPFTKKIPDQQVLRTIDWPNLGAPEEPQLQTQAALLTWIGEQGSSSSSTDIGKIAAYNHHQHPQLLGAGAAAAASASSWNQQIGGIQEHDHHQQRLIAASQPTTSMVEDDSSLRSTESLDTDLQQLLVSMLDADDDDPSPGAGGDQDQRQTLAENAAAGFHDQLSVQPSSDNADELQDYQHLLYDPAAAVEAEKECLEQQGLM